MARSIVKKTGECFRSKVHFVARMSAWLWGSGTRTWGQIINLFSTCSPEGCLNSEFAAGTPHQFDPTRGLRENLDLSGWLGSDGSAAVRTILIVGAPRNFEIGPNLNLFCLCLCLCHWGCLIGFAKLHPSFLHWRVDSVNWLPVGVISF